MFMIRSLFIYSFALMMLLSIPATLKASYADMYIVDQSVDEEITITVNGQWVLVNGAQGQTLEVVSLTGRCVMNLKIESPSQRVELNGPKGCYILKIGKVVRKIAIR